MGGAPGGGMGAGKMGGTGGMAGGGGGMSPMQFAGPPGGGAGGPGGGMGGSPGGGMGGGQGGGMSPIATPMSKPGGGGGMGGGIPTPMPPGRGAGVGGGGMGGMSGPQMAAAQAGGGPPRGGTTPSPAQMVAQRTAQRGPQMASASPGATPAPQFMNPRSMSQPPGMPPGPTAPSRPGAQSTPMGLSPMGPGGGSMPGTSLQELSPGSFKSEQGESGVGGEGRGIASDAPRSMGAEARNRRGRDPLGPNSPQAKQARAATPDKPMWTGYTPGKGDRKIEGGNKGSRDNPLHRIEDWEAGKSPHVSVAGRPDQFGMRGTAEKISIGDRTFNNVPVRVEDTGKKTLFGKGTNHFDVAHSGNPNAPVKVEGWNPIDAMQNIASTVTGGMIPRAGGSPPGMPGGAPSRGMGQTAARARGAPPGAAMPPQRPGSVPPQGSPAGLPSAGMPQRPMPQSGMGGSPTGLPTPGGSPSRPPVPSQGGGAIPPTAQRGPLPYQTAPQRFSPMPGEQAIPGKGVYDPMRGVPGAMQGHSAGGPIGMPPQIPKGGSPGPGGSPIPAPVGRPQGSMPPPAATPQLSPASLQKPQSPPTAPQQSTPQSPLSRQQLDQQWANRPQFDYSRPQPGGGTPNAPTPTQMPPQAAPTGQAPQPAQPPSPDQRIQQQGQRALQENFSGSPQGQQMMQEMQQSGTMPQPRPPDSGTQPAPVPAPAAVAGDDGPWPFNDEGLHQVMQSAPKGANHEQKLQHLMQNAHRLDPQSRQQLQQINRAYQRERHGLGPEPQRGYPERLRNADTYRGEYIGPQQQGGQPVGRTSRGQPVHVGAQAHNPQTGEVLQFTGKGWEPMPKQRGGGGDGGTKAQQQAQPQARGQGGRGGKKGQNPFAAAAKAIKPQAIGKGSTRARVPPLHVHRMKPIKRFHAKRRGSG